MYKILIQFSFKDLSDIDKQLLQNEQNVGVEVGHKLSPMVRQSHFSQLLPLVHWHFKCICLFSLLFCVLKNFINKNVWDKSLRRHNFKNNFYISKLYRTDIVKNIFPIYLNHSSWYSLSVFIRFRIYTYTYIYLQYVYYVHLLAYVFMLICGIYLSCYSSSSIV